MIRPFLTLCLFLTVLSASADEWQSRLDDALPLARISIPGSHDAATGNGFIPSQASWTAPGQTQGCSLAEQFAAGVRAFDLRPAAIATDAEPELLLFHGPRQTNISLAAAFHMFIDSLRTHPREFIIIIINHESEADGDSSLWCEALTALLTAKDINNYLIDYSPTLTVGNLRGHILVLFRQSCAATMPGGLIDDWGFSDKLQDQMSATIESRQGKGQLYVQDYYDTTGEKLQTKLSCIENMLVVSQDEPSDTPAPLIINHTSGYSATIVDGEAGAATTDAYIRNASATNARAVELLEALPQARGIIVMDYAGVDRFEGQEVYGARLVRTIIEQNFR